MDWLTVAALTAGPVPPRQSFWLCRDPECPVVYFGSGGTVIETDGLRAEPGFKQGSQGLLCYCFGYRRADLEHELTAIGTTGIQETIKHAVQAGNCACEVRNPSGRCCLGEVERAVRQLQAARASSHATGPTADGELP